MKRCGLPSMVGLLLLALCACGRGGDGLRVADGTPVVIVSIDTLRSDRLPIYGYRGVETPALDAFARQAIVFEHAFTHVPLTLPAHASLLTGLLPPEHGVRDNVGYRLETERLPYLPRLLRQNGYRTGAAVSAFVMRGVSGLAEGFELYDDRIEFGGWALMGNVQRPGRATLEPAVAWLREVAAEPFFLFFHIYEPHTPYHPAEPFASRYPSPYDAEIATADQVVGELFAELERLGVWKQAMVIVLSDHGEGLGDHGDYEHGPLLYREVLQIPLMLKLPGGERGGTRVAAPAQLIDVMPTLLGVLGLEASVELPGSSLLDLEKTGSRQLYAETYFPRLHFGWSELTSLIEFPHHFIFGPDPELYDLAVDPGSTKNLVREQRRVTAELDRALEAIDLKYASPSQVDPETRRKLAALGYVGSVGEVSGPLPDPKSRLHSLDAARRGFGHFEKGELEPAIILLRQVVAEEPRMVDAWEHLGHALLRLGRLEEAREVYQRAFEISDGAPQVALSLAGALLQLGRYQEAREHAELALPAQPAAHDVLAQAALKQGDLAAAERHALEAVRIRGTRAGPLITLAEVRVAQERLEEALQLTRDAEGEIGPRRDRELFRGLFFVRGNAHARLGQGKEAERAFLQAIELFPDELPSYTHLALVYALEGRNTEVAAILRRMIAANPNPEGFVEAVKALRVMGDPGSAASLLREAQKRWPQDQKLRELAG